MSDVDPTPGTPVTVGDRLGWWRGELRAQLATQHAELLAALSAQNAALLAAIQASAASGGATEATSQAILDAIGELSTFPAGWTVRALLAQLNTSIDVDMGTKEGQPPTSGLNPDPGACAGFDMITPIRLYMRDTGAEWTDNFSRTYKIYHAIMPNVGYSGGTLQSISGGQCASASSNVRMCISWDWTGSEGVAPYWGVGWGPTIEQAYIPNLGLQRTEPGGTGGMQLHSLVDYTYISVFFGRISSYSSIPANAFLHLGPPAS
jgi:hypothetical protein